MTPKPHSRWQLDPESPFYDEFDVIHPGQWWITTPTGVIGCSEEEDARTILGLVEQLEKAKAEAEALREHYTTLVHRHYHAKREAEERLNSAVYEYEKDLAAAEAALQKIEKEAELRSERHIAAIAHRALGGGV